MIFYRNFAIIFRKLENQNVARQKRKIMEIIRRNFEFAKFRGNFLKSPKPKELFMLQFIISFDPL